METVKLSDLQHALEVAAQRANRELRNSARAPFGDKHRHVSAGIAEGVSYAVRVVAESFGLTIKTLESDVVEDVGR